MTRLKEERKWRTSWGAIRSGERVTAGEMTAVPQSRALSVRCPHGGWVWNRPVGLLVERDGQKWRVPILDVTRVVQLGLYGLSVAFVLAGLWMMIRQRRN